MKLKIGFAYDAQADYILGSGDTPDKYAELDSKDTIVQIEDALKSNGYEVIRIGNAKKLIERIVSGERWDIVFNICEGLEYRNRESQVPAILEVYDIPYIGSDALTMGVTLDKVVSKKIIEHHKISTPDFKCISHVGEVKKNEKWINEHLPVIVKPAHEGTSKGLSKESLCRSVGKVISRVDWVVKNYNQRTLIEKFIKGYEFTVVVIGNNPPEAFPPVQILIKDKEDLGEDFYTYGRVLSPDIKYICPAKIDPKLDRKILKLALEAYEALECRDLGRIDVRVDYEGNPYFLECNPLPHLGLDDVFPLAAKATNRTYEETISLIAKSALKRLRMK
jgi:D-alanine-D-alanine ligase